MIFNLFTTFAWGQPADRERPLLITQDGTTFSYADAWRESARIANYLTATGLEPGDRITVQAPKSPYAVWLYLACLRAGFIYHPLNDAYQPAELEFFVNDAEPRVIVCHPDSEDIFAELVAGRDCRLFTMDKDGQGSLADAADSAPEAFNTFDCDQDTIAVLLYSSGTTGKPKGAMLSHGNLAANTATLVRTWGFTGDDQLLHALPVYHAHGLFVGLGCVMTSGCAMTFLPKFDVREVMRCLPESTVMMGIPTFYSRLLGESDFVASTCRSIRLFISGSAPLPTEMHAQFKARTGHAILERYGMTETSMLSSNPLNGERRPGTVGLALPGISIRVVDATGRPVTADTVGEIEVMGPNVFKGYWRLEEKTAAEFTADGYFRTGDQGSLGDDGYLTIIGRSKDMIISGGLNVYPREVEQAIDNLDGVAESAVIGVPHADFGEGVIALVVVEPGFKFVEQDMIATLRGQLANFKRPKRLILVPQLPRNTMGKVQKNTLRQQYDTGIVMTKTIGPRLRRSALFMPGSNRRALDKARELAVDVVIMDLEDAVAPDAKEQARANIIEAVAAGGYGHREIVIRINGYGSPWWKEDLVAVATSGADAMLAPKINGADLLSKLGDLLAINGAPDSMRLWAMAETPTAILKINSIANADPRLEVIVMGTSDLAKALRIPPDPDRIGLLPALTAGILAARAHGLDILDGVFADLADHDGFTRSCEQGRKLGFDGKTLIHPGQIEAANRLFGVSEDDLAAAVEIIAAWEAAAAQGSGIAVVNGRMIENLHAEDARRVVELHSAIIDDKD